MTTATAPHEIPCPDCGRTIQSKSVGGAKRKLGSHRKRVHPPSEPVLTNEDILAAKVHLEGPNEPPPPPQLAPTPGPQVFDAGSGPRDGGSDIVSEVTERLGAAVAEGVERENLIVEEPQVKTSVDSGEASTGQMKVDFSQTTTGQLLDGLYKVDEVAVLTWIRATFKNERTLKAAIYDAGLGKAQ